MTGTKTDGYRAVMTEIHHNLNSILQRNTSDPRCHTTALEEVVTHFEHAATEPAPADIPDIDGKTKLQAGRQYAINRAAEYANNISTEWRATPAERYTTCITRVMVKSFISVLTSNGTSFISPAAGRAEYRYVLDETFKYILDLIDEWDERPGPSAVAAGYFYRGVMEAWDIAEKFPSGERGYGIAAATLDAIHAACQTIHDLAEEVAKDRRAFEGDDDCVSAEEWADCVYDTEDELTEQIWNMARPPVYI